MWDAQNQNYKMTFFSLSRAFWAHKVKITKWSFFVFHRALWGRKKNKSEKWLFVFRFIIYIGIYFFLLTPQHFTVLREKTKINNLHTLCIFDFDFVILGGEKSYKVGQLCNFFFSKNAKLQNAFCNFDFFAPTTLEKVEKQKKVIL